MLVYGASYAVIRAQCQTIGDAFVVIPPYLASGGTLEMNVLGKLYKPLFLIEHRCTGRAFSVSLWGVAGVTDF